MSEPDYVEMGREMAENRDAHLVDAANRGLKCQRDWDQQLHELQRQCLEYGLVLEYSDGGMPVLHRKPAQEDTCQCGTCVGIRAYIEAKNATPQGWRKREVK